MNLTTEVTGTTAPKAVERKIEEPTVNKTKSISDALQVLELRSEGDVLKGLQNLKDSIGSDSFNEAVHTPNSQGKSVADSFIPSYQKVVITEDVVSSDSDFDRVRTTTFSPTQTSKQIAELLNIEEPSTVTRVKTDYSQSVSEGRIILPSIIPVRNESTVKGLETDPEIKSASQSIDHWGQLLSEEEN
jgi:hypothetical protein